jgi:hypothetical protein
MLSVMQYTTVNAADRVCSHAAFRLHAAYHTEPDSMAHVIDTESRQGCLAAKKQLCKCNCPMTFWNVVRRAYYSDKLRARLKPGHVALASSWSLPAHEPQLYAKCVHRRCRTCVLFGCVDFGLGLSFASIDAWQFIERSLCAPVTRFCSVTRHDATDVLHMALYLLQCVHSHCRTPEHLGTLYQVVVGAT